MKRLQTFYITGTGADRFEVSAHFVVPTMRDGVRLLLFFLKPHWYSRRRCVAVLGTESVHAITNQNPAGDRSFLKEAGIKL